MRLDSLALVLVLSGCGAASPPAPLPALPPHPPPHAPLDVDTLPGSVAELEPIALDEAAGERGLMALEKLSALLHASAIEPAAAQALRRLYLRVTEGPRSTAFAAALISALDAAGALEEADALRRHLACPSRFPYTPGPDGAPAPVDALAQDHDQKYWERWDALHPVAIDLAPRTKTNGGNDADTRYTSLYATCPDDVTDPASAEARAAAWLAVARAHRTRDGHAGPFAIPRAVEAYQHAIRSGATAPRGPAMRHARLELGDALHAHERYHAAAEELSRALTLCDETAACAPVEREEALSLLADSLTHLDFEGPPADAPVVARPDVMDTEVRPDVVEAKLRVALDRAIDPRLIGRDPAFAPDLLAALAQLYVELNLLDDARLSFAELRQRFPTHRELPRVLQAVARVNGMSARFVRPAQAAPRWVRTVGAWDDLASVAGAAGAGSAWRSANAGDADALTDAAQRVNDARGELANALASLVSSLDAAARAPEPLPLDAAAAQRYFRRAIDTWTTRASASAGQAQARAVLAAVRTSELVWLTRSGVAIDAGRWTEARSAGLLARDALDAGAQRGVAARTLVDLADAHIRYEEVRFAASHGALGLAPRDRALRAPFRAPRFEALPTAVAEAVNAREGLAAATSDVTWASVEAHKGAAGLLLAYGHATEAEGRLAVALALVCRKPGGMDVFVLSAEVARAAKDEGELRRLSALHANPSTTCAQSPAERLRGQVLTKP